MSGSQVKRRFVTILTLFWDKNTPKTIPEVLLRLNLPVGIEYYLKHFPYSDSQPENGDDKWFPQVAAWGWTTIISQDYNFHTKENEKFALRHYGLGCFYLWGAEARKWEILQCFARAYDNIVQAAETTPRPFIYEVTRTGKLRRVAISDL